MSSCAVKYEILVWAGVPLSDPFILLFYVVLRFSTLLYGVLLFYVTLRYIMVFDCFTLPLFYYLTLRYGVLLKFRQNFDRSTCPVKYGKLWSEMGYPYLTRLFYCFTVFYVSLRYFMVFYCFTLRYLILWCFTVLRYVTVCYCFTLRYCVLLFYWNFVEISTILNLGRSLGTPIWLVCFTVLRCFTIRYVTLWYFTVLRYVTIR
jgi:hypothetical protein